MTKIGTKFLTGRAEYVDESSTEYVDNARTNPQIQKWIEDNGKDIKPLFDGAERGAEDHGVMLHSDFGSLSMEEIDELLS